MLVCLDAALYKVWTRVGYGPETAHSHPVDSDFWFWLLFSEKMNWPQNLGQAASSFVTLGVLDFWPLFRRNKT